ncbi:GTP-binding protein RAD-like [Saccostrea echinata]|uniref:GTP-binding protein RAD-like n=1 Tax=Saccostrea echinata TaxID=191078 RepID=UPI002A81CD3F|nr:GTP-binding protein RAD-like [Saccostrea echinata]
MTKEKMFESTSEEATSLSYPPHCVKTSIPFFEYPPATSNFFRIGRPSISAPHSRSCSMRKVKHDQNTYHMDRNRRNSLPLDYTDVDCTYFSSEIQSSRVNSHESFQRVRSFKMTSKGLINHGDSVRNKNRSTSASRSSSLKENRRQRMASNDSCDTCSSVSSCSSGYYRVVILGTHSVGKTAIMNQFMTSEYTGGLDLGPEENSNSMNVSVLLDGEESSLEFMDSTVDQDIVCESFFDAFVFVFSVDDVTSFERVNNTMYHLRHNLGSDRPFILVANKIDLVRNRKVTPAEVRKVANRHDAKYIETSVTLHHHVDELLVGILRQIRIKLNIILPESTQTKNKRGPKGLLKKLFRINRKGVEPEENVFD